MWSRGLAGAIVLLAGCDRRADTLLPQNVTDVPAVVEVGMLQVLTVEEYAEYLATGDRQSWCAELDDDGAMRCLYAQVGPPAVGQKGGATYTFLGNGGNVCLVTDPEAVFWNQSRAAQGPDERFIYPDYTSDDGDIDMFAGLTSYYTGSPGIELGDFTGYYTDSLGREIEIEYGECTQTSSVSDITNAHAGRGTAEYCTINTDQRTGIEFTVMLETFSVPPDDGVLAFGALAVEGTCRTLSVDECTIRTESLDAKSGEVVDCFAAMEDAYCEGSDNDEGDLEGAWLDQGYSLITGFCCANPEMCGIDIDDSVCLAFDRDAFCGDFPSYCCGD